jgi:hypothetical protein
VRAMRCYAIPADEAEHEVRLRGGRPAHPAARWEPRQGLYLVEFWAEHDEDQPETTWRLRVFSTGERLPGRAVHLGTTVSDLAGLAWHLYVITWG